MLRASKPPKATKAPKAAKVSTAQAEPTSARPGVSSAEAVGGRPDGLTDKEWLFCNEYLEHKPPSEQATNQSGLARRRQSSVQNVALPRQSAG